MASMANMGFGLSIILVASVISVHAQKCEHLVDIDNGSLKYGDVDVLNDVGGTVTFECCKGFTLVGDATLTCQAGGSWDKPVPKCLNSCPAFFGLQDGITKGQPEKKCRNFEVGCELSFKCNDGRKIVGDDKIRCQDDFTWSGSPPKCIENLCPPINFILNGEFKTNNLLPVPGAEIEFECDTGFELQGDAKLTCQEDTNQWSADVPTCECKTAGPECDEAKKACPSVVTPNYGQYKKVGNNKTIGKGTVELVKCLRPETMIQRRLRIRERVIVKCENGIWGDFEKCEDVSCPHQEYIRNGFISGHFVTLGQKRRTRCSSGHKLDGPERQMCGEMKKWQPDGPVSCKAKQCKECPAIKSIANGVAVEYCNKKNGGKAKFECDDGFSLTGEAELTCQIDRNGKCEWSNNPPTCQRIVGPNVIDECSSKQIDVYFLVDDSSDTSADNRKLLQEFIRNVISKFDIGPQFMRVALITYNNEATVRYDIDAHPTNADALLAATVLSGEGGSRRLGRGILSALGLIQQGDRSSKEILVIIETAESTLPFNALFLLQNQLPSSVVTLTMTVGDFETADFTEDVDLKAKCFNELEKLTTELAKRICTGNPDGALVE